ncbi:MAG TPA: hypothetical protein VGE07_16690 [Herpetosiphonaceae bacterium]
MTTTIKNTMLLAATKAQAEGRRHPEGSPLQTIARETGITTRAIAGIAQGTIRQYPKDILLTLCGYFGCGARFYNAHRHQAYGCEGPIASNSCAVVGLVFRLLVRAQRRISPASRSSSWASCSPSWLASTSSPAAWVTRLAAQTDGQSVLIIAGPAASNIFDYQQVEFLDASGAVLRTHPAK